MEEGRRKEEGGRRAEKKREEIRGGREGGRDGRKRWRRPEEEEQASDHTGYGSFEVPILRVVGRVCPLVTPPAHTHTHDRVEL